MVPPTSTPPRPSVPAAHLRFAPSPTALPRSSSFPAKTVFDTLPPDFPVDFGQVVFSEDDRRLVASSRQDPLVRVWDIVSGEPLATIGPFDHPVEDVDLSADGSRVLTAGRSIEFWDAVSGERVGGFTTDQHFVFTAAFAADERFVVTGGADGNVRVWEASTGRPVAADVVDPEFVGDASMSADGQLLATGLRGSALLFDCAACHPASELLDDAREAIENRPTSPD